MERDGEMEVEGYKEGGATVVSTPYEQRNENMRQLTNTQVHKCQVHKCQVHKCQVHKFHVPSAHMYTSAHMHTSAHKCQLCQHRMSSGMKTCCNSSPSHKCQDRKKGGDYLETKFGFWNW